jgi:lysosome membrane protein 2
MEYKGIPGYRYETKADFIAELDPKYKTGCFCVDKVFNGITKPNGCLYSGAMDLTNCLGAPVILTLPHMMNASPVYSDRILGFNPDSEKHKIFMEVEPRTGSPLRGAKRVQFNMFLRRIPNIDISRKLSVQPILMPAVWVDEVSFVF